MEALQKGELNRTLHRNTPRTTQEFHNVVEEYARGKDGDLAKGSMEAPGRDVLSREKNRDPHRKNQTIKIIVLVLTSRRRN
jgi:hypothetical protein